MKKIILPLVTVAFVAACSTSENEMNAIAPQTGAASSSSEATVAPVDQSSSDAVIAPVEQSSSDAVVLPNIFIENLQVIRFPNIVLVAKGYEFSLTKRKDMLEVFFEA